MLFVCLNFDALHPSQQFSVKLRHFLGGTFIKQMIKCLVQGHKTVPPVTRGVTLKLV